jgi:peptide/nickel transport system substrate-binding protein
MLVVRRTVIRSAALVAIATLSTAVLVACGGSGPSGGNGGGNGGETAQSLAEKTQFNPQPYENIRDGGTLTTSLPEISPQFNTFHIDATTYTLAVWRWYNPILITFTPDGQAVYDPDYLTDVKPETVDGNTRITYTINPKATYNDGSPLDWRSFESTWKTSNGTDPAYLVSSTDGYDRITSLVRGVDDRQVVVTFRGINLWWQGLFNVLVNPKAAADPAVYNQGYVTTPHNEWGAGPYQVQKYDQQNGVIVFERNPKWWGRPGKLDTRTFVTLEDVASLNAFRNGQIDAVDVGSKDRYAQVQGQPGIEIRKGPSLQMDYFTLNGESPVLSDPRVRKAIFEAIDRKQILKFHFDGLDYSSEPGGSMIFLPFQNGYADNVGKVVTFDPEQAKKDLDAAGWTVGPDGVRVKDGQPLKITYVNTGDDPVGKAIAGGTAAMLKNVGAQLDIRQVPSADFSTILTGKQFDMFYSAVSQSDPFGIAYICQIYCSTSGFIKSGVNDPKNDELIRSVNTQPTPEAQYANAADAETAALRTFGILPTVNVPAILAVKTGLANYGAGRFFTPTPETIGWQK